MHSLGEHFPLISLERRLRCVGVADGLDEMESCSF